jgi:replicative DNA helicase
LVIDKFNMQVSAVFIDYGGLIRGAEDYNKISSIARGLKELSKKLNTRVMCAVQLSRAAGDGTIPVTMDMLRDSGAWEEAADYIIGAWFSRSDQHRIHASILKNRQGERDVLFDIINKGLYYHTEDVKADIFVPSTGF